MVRRRESSLGIHSWQAIKALHIWGRFRRCGRYDAKALPRLLPRRVECQARVHGAYVYPATVLTTTGAAASRFRYTSDELAADFASQELPTRPWVRATPALLAAIKRGSRLFHKNLGLGLVEGVCEVPSRLLQWRDKIGVLCAVRAASPEFR